MWNLVTYLLVAPVLFWLSVLGVVGCAMYDHPTATVAQKSKDEVECKALSEQGAGPQGSVTYAWEQQRLFKLCLESRGWMKR